MLGVVWVVYFPISMGYVVSACLLYDGCDGVCSVVNGGVGVDVKIC